MTSFRLAVLSALITASQVQAQLGAPMPVADLGEIKSGLPLTHSFEFINHGPEAVEILETRASCGCVVGKVEPRIIPPGQCGSLTMKMHTLGQAAGSHSWKATVRYRQGNCESEITVGINVSLTTEVSVQPAMLTLITESELTQVVTLTDWRSEPLRVTGVQTSKPCLKARLLSQGREGPCYSAQIQLEAGHDLSPGRHDEELTIDTTDIAYRQLKVPVTIIKTSQTVTAVPARVELQTAAGQPASCLVRLRSASAKAVVIGQIDSNNPALKCRWAPGPGTQATVRIQAEPKETKSQAGIVTIHLTSPKEEIIQVPVLVRWVD